MYHKVGILNCDNEKRLAFFQFTYKIEIGYAYLSVDSRCIRYEAIVEDQTIWELFEVRRVS